MEPAALEDKTTLRERVCDLARNKVMNQIENLAQDRMGQGEVLEDLLTGLDDTHDNEVFTLYETYLRRIRRGVKNLPIHL